jgi:antitoxin (DNA-binding transcriptional repressor) of toxin-antitoxin stability system
MAHPLVPGIEILSQILASGRAGGDSGPLSLISLPKDLHFLLTLSVWQLSDNYISFYQTIINEGIFMQFITVRELSTKPREIWEKIRKEEIIITSNGKPVAILSGVTEETLEKTLKTIRRGRALLALEEMQQQSLDRGLDRLTDTEIEKVKIDSPLEFLEQWGPKIGPA